MSRKLLTPEDLRAEAARLRRTREDQDVHAGVDTFVRAARAAADRLRPASPAAAPIRVPASLAAAAAAETRPRLRARFGLPGPAVRVTVTGQPGFGAPPR